MTELDWNNWFLDVKGRRITSPGFSRQGLHFIPIKTDGFFNKKLIAIGDIYYNDTMAVKSLGVKIIFDSPLEEISFIENKKSAPKCNCDIFTLCNLGCKCGGS